MKDLIKRFLDDKPSKGLARVITRGSSIDRDVGDFVVSDEESSHTIASSFISSPKKSEESKNAEIKTAKKKIASANGNDNDLEAAYDYVEAAKDMIVAKIAELDDAVFSGEGVLATLTAEDMDSVEGFEELRTAVEACRARASQLKDAVGNVENGMEAVKKIMGDIPVNDG